MANVPDFKFCEDCRKEYKPTSSAQKRCPECKGKHTKEHQREYAERKKAIITPPSPSYLKRGQATTSTKSLNKISKTVIARSGETKQSLQDVVARLTAKDIIDKLTAERDRIEQAIVVIEKYV